MKDFDAINIAEGYTEAKDEAEYLKAWQHLIDTGMCWTLQGWFGRRAMALIEAKICKPVEGHWSAQTDETKDVPPTN